MPIRAHWRGNPADPTEFHPGIPTRSLDDQDWAELSNEQRDTVRGSKLYRYVPQLTRAQRQARASQAPDAEEPSDDQAPAEQPTQPDDPVTTEPAVAAEEGQGF